MIVEVTGIPCSGKSYYLNYLSVEYNCVVLDKQFINNFLHISCLPCPVSFIIREFYHLFTGITKLNFYTIKFLLKYLFYSKWSFYRKVNVFRNVVKKYSLHYIVYKNEDIDFIVDEGVCHIPFIFATAKQNYTPELLINHYNLDINVIIIKSETKILFKRILKRGHSFINSHNHCDLILFIIKNQISSILQIYLLRKHSINYKFFFN